MKFLGPFATESQSEDDAYDEWRTEMDDNSAKRIAKARALLELADQFYGDIPGEPEAAQTLNMNDVWGWAMAWGEYVPDEELPRVAELFKRYGDAGVLYWVSEHHGQMRSEFEDNNRFIDFVRHEEKLRQEVPDSNKRAYKKLKYTLGG